MGRRLSKVAVVLMLGSIAQTACAGPNPPPSSERAGPRAGERSGETSMLPHVRIERDIAYGPDPAQRLDVYRPEHSANAPVILMVHGGGWRRGDKARAPVVEAKVRHWVPEGYVFISANYRLTPSGVTPLEEAEDVARALAFAQSHAGSWGADPSRFILMGHSAGGHLVALLTADPSIATRLGARPWLGTVSLDAAGYDIVEMMEGRHFSLYDQAFGKDTNSWRAASPTLRLEKATVPLLLVCSSRRVISCQQAREFADKATTLGGRATVLPVDMSHGEINALLGADNAYTAKVDAFIRSLGA